MGKKKKDGHNNGTKKMSLQEFFSVTPMPQRSSGILSPFVASRDDDDDDDDDDETLTTIQATTDFDGAEEQQQNNSPMMVYDSAFGRHHHHHRDGTNGVVGARIGFRVIAIKAGKDNNNNVGEMYVTLDAVDATLEGKIIKRVECTFGHEALGKIEISNAPFRERFSTPLQGVDVLIKITFRSSLHRPPVKFTKSLEFFECEEGDVRETTERVDFKPELLKKILRAKGEESGEEEEEERRGAGLKSGSSSSKKKDAEGRRGFNAQKRRFTYPNNTNTSNMFRNLDVESSRDDDDDDDNGEEEEEQRASSSRRKNHEQTPADPNVWTVQDVANWLKSNRLGFLVSRFTNSAVDGYVLLRLTDQDVLKDLRVTSHVERLRLFRNIDALKASRVPFEEKTRSLEIETRDKLNIVKRHDNDATNNNSFNTPVDLLEADVSWLQFVLPMRRLAALTGWLSHVVDEVIERFDVDVGSKRETIAAQISVYCVSAIKAELDIPHPTNNDDRSKESTRKSRIKESLETVSGWSKQLELFDDPKTLDVKQLQRNLIALHLLLKEEEEEEDNENHAAANVLRGSGGLSTPPPQLNAKAQSFVGSGTSIASLGELETLTNPSRSASPSNMHHHLRHVSSVMELAEECEIRYDDIEFSTGEASSSNRIGRGGFGEVFLGRYNGSLVAVKRLFESPVGKGLEEFKREVSVLSTLRHPSIVLWLGACTVSPNTAIILEYMDRGSLHDVLHRSEAVLNLPTRIRWSISIAKAMAYLHTHKPHAIIHCDLNCNNVLVNRDGAVKVTDFGLSKVKQHSKATRQTGVTGTVSYAAPEVIVGNQFTESSDIFSYGVTIWEIVARKIPWDGLTEYQIVYRMSSALDNPDTEYAACEQHLKMTETTKATPFSPPLQSILRDCWFKLPERRPKMGDVLVRMIEAHKVACKEERTKRRENETSSASSASK